VREALGRAVLCQLSRGPCRDSSGGDVNIRADSDTSVALCSGMIHPGVLGQHNLPALGTGPLTVVEVVEAIPTLFGFTPAESFVAILTSGPVAGSASGCA